MTEGKGNRDLGSSYPSQFHIAEIAKRASLMLNYGEVFEADYDAGKVRVRIGSGDKCVETEWLSLLQIRSGNSRKWSVPEVGEWVTMLAPYGELSSGIVIGSRPKASYPNEALTENVERETFYYPGTNEPLLLEDQHRDEAKRRRWVKEHGEFRHEVGGPYDGSGEPISGIVQNKDSITVRVGTTQIVIKDGSIVASVKGQEVELSLLSDSINAHVNKKSVWRMLADKITSTVEGKGVLDITASSITGNVEKDGHFVITKSSVGMFVVSATARMVLAAGKALLNLGSSIVELTGASISSRVPGSEHLITPVAIANNTSLMLVPQLSELTGPNPIGGSFDGSEQELNYVSPTFPEPDKLTQAPLVVKGKPPYTPTN